MRRGRGCAAALAVLVVVGLVPETVGYAQAPVPGDDDAAVVVVDAGSLRVEISEAPWRLTFRDAEGGVVVREHGGRGPGPTGSLGFFAPDPEAEARGWYPAKPQTNPWEDPTGERGVSGWWRATEVVESSMEDGRYEARVATTAAGRMLRVTIGPDAEGVIGVQARVEGPDADVGAVGIGFEARSGERLLGLGERSNAVDQRGNLVENYVGEGPYQDEEYPFLQAGFVPLWGIRWRREAAYYPVPWVLSSAGYGVLLDNDEPSYHRLGSDDPEAWSAEVEARELRLRVFAGPSPAQALERFTATTGRQPFPDAPWFFGPWFQTGHDDREPEEREYMRRLREADAPVSVAETHMRYLPCGTHREHRDFERERTDFFNRHGLAVLTYFTAQICSEYEGVFDEADERGLLYKRPNGESYTYPAFAGGRDVPLTIMSMFDYTHPDTVPFYADLLREAIEDGHEGWMQDFGEYTPLDARAHDGSTGWEWHNRYPTDYHCAIHRWAEDFTRRTGQPLARFNRSGWTGTAPCAPLVWGGDPTTAWGFDGLESAVIQALSIGLSGVSSWASDIGGFFSLGTNELSEELLIRWIQFGAATTLMRTKAEGVAVPDKDRPQIWEDAIVDHWRRWAKFHTQLNPYLLGATTEYVNSGLPVMRHHVLSHPDDEVATALEDQYLFGPDLLVAPILRPDDREREVYLPEGNWIDLWRAVDYDPETGGLVMGGDETAAAEVLEGRQWVTVPAPLDELPVMARAGMVLPMLSWDVYTLTEHGSPEDPVRAVDRQDQMELLALPRGDSDTRFNRDETMTSQEHDPGWSLHVDGDRERTYRLQASLATLETPFTPCAVELDGEEVADWSYDGATAVLRADFTVTAGELVVTACDDGRPPPGPGNGPPGEDGRPPRDDGQPPRDEDDAPAPDGRDIRNGAETLALPATGGGTPLLAVLGLLLTAALRPRS